MAEITVIHGPTYSEVEARGYAGGLHELAGAEPDKWMSIIGDIHAGYAEAGADLIVAATWGTQPGRDMRVTQSLSEQQQRIIDVAQVACEVASYYDRRVVASIAPLGDCYGKPDGHFIGPYDPQSASVQRRFLEHMLSAGISDVLLETFPSTIEIDLTLQAAKEIGARVIGISMFAAPDQHGVLRLPGNRDGLTGETFAEAVRKYDQSEQLDDLEFISANCIDPNSAVTAVSTMRDAATRVAIGVWPNSADRPASFESSGKIEVRTDVERQRFASIIGDCIQAGASWVGGCCGTDAVDIVGIRANEAVRTIGL